MTIMGAVSCILIGLGPCISLFIFTIAHSPTKVIVLTASAFFWLVSLLLTGLLWAGFVHWLPYLWIGMTIAIIMQEIMRCAFYALITKADTGLQWIAHSPNTPATSSGVATEQLSDPSAVPVLASTHPNRLINEISVPPAGVFNQNVIAYVAGVGFGLIGAVMQLTDIVLITFHTDITLSRPGSTNQLMLIALDTGCMSVMQVAWSLILWHAFKHKLYFNIAGVYLAHLGISALSLLNTNAPPCPEWVCAIYICCTVTCCLWAYLTLSYRLTMGKLRTTRIGVSNVYSRDTGGGVSSTPTLDNELNDHATLSS